MRAEATIVEWGGRKIPYLEWLEKPVAENWPYPITGAEVEALSLIGLKLEVGDEVKELLGESEKVLIGSWNGLQPKIHGAALRESFIKIFIDGMWVKYADYQEDFKLIQGGLLALAVQSRQAALIKESI